MKIRRQTPRLPCSPAHNTRTQSMRLFIERRFRRSDFLTAASFLVLLLNPGKAGCQVDPARLRSTYELGASLGGTWLEGPRAPDITSGAGIFGAIGVQRSFAPNVLGAVNLRVLSAAVSLDESSMTRDGGRTRVVSLLAQASFQQRVERTYRPSLELAGGISRLSGRRDLVPFKDASNIAPTAEIGVSLRRGFALEDAARQEFSVYVKYSVMQLRMSAGDAIAESGAVSRIHVGMRATR